MAGEQRLQTLADIPRDAEGRELPGRQIMRLMDTLQGTQRIGHLGAAAQTRPALVGPELAVTREPHHDHAGQEGEQDLGDDRDDEVGDAVPSSFLKTTRSTVWPMMRARKTTKVLTTPWISASVTMSPFAT
jgi:hypothetical protein